MKKLLLPLLLLITHLYADVEKGKAVYAANCAICHTLMEEMLWDRTST